MGGLCTPLKTAADAFKLITYFQTPLFAIAEGDYPFPSDYITYALQGITTPLPAWPARKVCSLVQDLPVEIEGNRSQVDFSVSMGGVDGKVQVKVNWRDTIGNGYNAHDLDTSGALRLFSRVSDALAIWYNASGLMKCHDWQSSNNTSSLLQRESRPQTQPVDTFLQPPQTSKRVCTRNSVTVNDAWGAICCNENLKLVQYLVQGVGNDMYWPPSEQFRNFSYDDVVSAADSHSCAPSFAASGLYGVPTTKPDPWATNEQVSYGGKWIGRAGVSNIVFSNGLLDPWCAAGVLSPPSAGLQAVTIDQGGHHLDLFFPTPQDPPSAIKARQVEEVAIRKWISEAASATPGSRTESTI